MRRVLPLILIVVVLLGLVGWRLNVKTKADAVLKASQLARKNAPTTVTLATVQTRDILNQLEVVGSVVSPYNVRLSPKTAGLIEYLEVREGDQVKAGQVLVKIDPTEIEGQVLQAQASVAEARSRLAQAQITQNPTTVNVTAGIRQQHATVASAKADYNQTYQNYSAQVASSQASVTDAEAKVASAKSGITNAEANLKSAKASFSNSKAKYDRTYSLYKQGFVAPQDVDDARTAMDVADGQVSVAEGQLQSSKSSLQSALAMLNSAKQQLTITERKGKSDVEASRARLTQAGAGLDVAAANRAQVPAYKANLAALEAQVVAAEAQLRQAQARRSDTSLRSTVDGTVTSRVADPGAIASPGQPILTIQYLKWLYVTASVPIEDIAKVTLGEPLSFTVDALPGKTFTAKIAQINPSADSQSRQFTILLKIDNQTGILRPGMYARINIVLDHAHALLSVPREAVKLVKGATVVYAVDPQSHKAKAVPVVVGASDAQYQEVKGALSPGDKVVALSYQLIKEGQAVRDGGAGGQGAGGGKSGKRGATQQ